MKTALKYLIIIVVLGFGISILQISCAQKSTVTIGGRQSSSNPILAPLPSSENQTFTVNGVSFVMVGVQGGTFIMGATSEQGSDARDDEKPVHQVKLSDFSIGQTEVTQELWKAVMGSNPSEFKGSKRPVEQISWEECDLFIIRLNSLTGSNFRLPTEAEWEYVARGGSVSKGYKYCGSNNYDEVAWFNLNSGSKTHTVATKKPNELGVYDMSGNVSERCQDWYDYNYYESSQFFCPTGPVSGHYRVVRGGAWNQKAMYCRVSSRDNDMRRPYHVSFGLRLAI